LPAGVYCSPEGRRVGRTVLAHTTWPSAVARISRPKQGCCCNRRPFCNGTAGIGSAGQSRGRRQHTRCASRRCSSLHHAPHAGKRKRQIRLLLGRRGERHMAGRGSTRRRLSAACPKVPSGQAQPHHQRSVAEKRKRPRRTRSVVILVSRRNRLSCALAAATVCSHPIEDTLVFRRIGIAIAGRHLQPPSNCQHACTA